MKRKLFASFVGKSAKGEKGILFKIFAELETDSNSSSSTNSNNNNNDSNTNTNTNTNPPIGEEDRDQVVLSKTVQFVIDQLKQNINSKPKFEEVKYLAGNLSFDQYKPKNSNSSSRRIVDDE